MSVTDNTEHNGPGTLPSLTPEARELGQCPMSSISAREVPSTPAHPLLNPSLAPHDSFCDMPFSTVGFLPSLGLG